MLHGVSWTEFFSYLIGCASGYYLVLCWKYYRHAFLQRLRQRAVHRQEAADTVARAQVDDQFAAAHQCANRLRGVFDLPEGQMEELQALAGIQLILREYTWLKGTPFQIALNNLLTYGWEQRFDRPLEENELESCWIGEG